MRPLLKRVEVNWNTLVYLTNEAFLLRAIRVPPASYWANCVQCLHACAAAAVDTRLGVAPFGEVNATIVRPAERFAVRLPVQTRPEIAGEVHHVLNHNSWGETRLSAQFSALIVRNLISPIQGLSQNVPASLFPDLGRILYHNAHIAIILSYSNRASNNPAQVSEFQKP